MSLSGYVNKKISVVNPVDKMNLGISVTAVTLLGCVFQVSFCVLDNIFASDCRRYLKRDLTIF